MNVLHKDAAVEAIKVLLPLKFTASGFERDAVTELICAVRETDQYEVATVAVASLLDRHENQSSLMLIMNADFLDRALHISDTWVIEYSVAERLVVNAAQAGFHGRFPGITTRLLDRRPSEREVVALVTAYVNNKASRSESTEDSLARLVNVFVRDKNRAAQIARINNFAHEFSNGID